MRFAVISVLVIILVTLLMAPVSAETTIPINWWGNRASHDGVTDSSCNSTPDPSDQSVRLDYANDGNMVGTVFLPYSGIWEMNFHIITDGNLPSYPTEYVEIYINSTLIATIINAPLGAIRPVNHTIEGSSFTYSLVFYSPSAICHKHLIVANGTLEGSGGNNQYPDSDGDGVPDYMDAFPDDPTEWEDTDEDSIGDNSDNCPDDPNLDQADKDLDGQGDACDTDDDNDGISDEDDNCQFDANSDQADSDGDNVGDECDNCPDDINPDQEDTDGDKIGDACQIIYVALGDSYSSGTGTGKGNYVPDTITDNNECRRSRIAYSTNAHGIPQGYSVSRYFFACHGAETDHVLDTWWNGKKEPKEPEETDEMPQSDNIELADADIVTITIGGNDADFAKVMMICMLNNNQCHELNFDMINKTYAEVISKRIEDIRILLREAYSKLKQKAPNAKIYVLGYPLIVEELSKNYNFGIRILDIPITFQFTIEEAQHIRQWGKQLNELIEEEAVSMGFRFVPVTRHFRGHLIGGDRWPYINLVKWPNKSESIHPNKGGHKAYARALQEKIDEVGDFPIEEQETLQATSQQASSFSMIQENFVDGNEPLPSLGNLLLRSEESSPCSGTGLFVGNQKIQVEGSGFASGTLAQIRYKETSEHDAVELTSVHADNDGLINTEITIPALQLPATMGILEALGVKPDGGVLLLTEILPIVASLEADSDSDGVPDACDNCANIDNPAQEDLDRDGIGNVCDNCPDDPENDIDGDGICAPNDPCDYDTDNDLDGDGICGDFDNCPDISNSDQADNDGDGIGYACDLCPSDPANDSDGDGICGDVDNCPTDANSNQADNDLDGQGDVCDTDDDDDGISDEGDNCQFVVNPDQVDSDGDGAGNVCDTDDDNDGVLDAKDQCASTPTGEIVDSSGCSIKDLCPCDSQWKNHGAYVKCVAHTSEDFVSDGIITETDKDIIVSNSAESECGHKK